LSLVPTTFVAWGCLYPSWLLLLSTVGAPIRARVLGRTIDARGFGVTVAYPVQPLLGPERIETQWLAVETMEYGALTPGRELPARRVGRGALQVVRVETDGKELDAELMAWTLVFVVPLAGGALAILWGPLFRDLWLVRWGHPVRGVVRPGAQRKGSVSHVVSFEYREMGPVGTSATLHGRAHVTRAQYEDVRAGQPLTILYSLWNPRWHVAYPFCRFAAWDPAPPMSLESRAGDPGAEGRG
jgi:hypothetical protein